MSFLIPTTKETTENNIVSYETKLAQDAPINDKAFINVQAAIEAMNLTQLFKFAAERALQNLATTATGADLDGIGAQFSVNKKLAIAAVLTADLPAANGTIISPTRTFISVLTGIRYTVESEVTAAGGVATLTLIAQETGSDGNLDPGAELTIDSPVAGAESTATVVSLDINGAPEEEQETYRVRVLDAIRESGGGGNSSDYRSWAQEVAGVKRAYPFSAQPDDSLAESSPPDRTVYVEAVVAIDPDGIAPGSLLDQVRDTITTDPATGLHRQPLGLTDETLFIVSIKRTGFFVEVRDLIMPLSLVAQAEQAVEDALTLFFTNLKSFVEGLDPDFERADLVTDLIISGVVDDVLSALGGSASGVGFGLTLGAFLPIYRLAPGELGKLIQVDFL